MMKYDSEWAIAVLNDLSAFFRANEMHVSSERTKALITTVTTEEANIHYLTNFDGSGYSGYLEN